MLYRCAKNTSWSCPCSKSLIILPWERRKLFKTCAPEFFPCLCPMIWMYYWNPQGWWVANSLTRVLSLDWLCFPLSCSFSCHWQGYMGWAARSAAFLGYPAASYKTDGSKDFFSFLDYRMQRNKYSGSVAASKPKGKVKCKHFSDFLVGL